MLRCTGTNRLVVEEQTSVLLMAHYCGGDIDPLIKGLNIDIAIVLRRDRFVAKRMKMVNVDRAIGAA